MWQQPLGSFTRPAVTGIQIDAGFLLGDTQVRRLDGVQGVDLWPRGDLDQIRCNGGGRVIVLLGQQVHQRVGDGVGRAVVTAARNQPELNGAKEVIVALFGRVAAVMPGTTMPHSGLAVGNFAVPLAPVHPKVVFLGDAQINSIDE